MRDSVLHKGIRYYRCELDTMRETAASLRRRAEDNHQVAKDLEQTIRDVETALNAPEPLVAGDIVTTKKHGQPGQRFFVLGAGALNALADEAWFPCREGYTRVTDGLNSWTNPSDFYIRVGNIREAK